jgi:hypothetical protein
MKQLFKYATEIAGQNLLNAELQLNVSDLTQSFSNLDRSLLGTRLPSSE